MGTVKTLFTLEFKSIATGYKIAGFMSEKFGLKSIEVFPQAPGKLVCLFETSDQESELTKHARSLRKHLVDWSLAGNQQVLLNAFYGQQKPTATDSVLIVESNSLSSIFLAADFLISDLKIQVIEIDSGRGFGGRSVLFASIQPEQIVAAKRIIKKLRSKMIVGTEVISPLPSQLKAHWSPSVQ